MDLGAGTRRKKRATRRDARRETTPGRTRPRSCASATKQMKKMTFPVDRATFSLSSIHTTPKLRIFSCRLSSVRTTQSYIFWGRLSSIHVAIQYCIPVHHPSILPKYIYILGIIHPYCPKVYVYFLGTLSSIHMTVQYCIRLHHPSIQAYCPKLCIFLGRSSSICPAQKLCVSFGHIIIHPHGCTVLYPGTPTIHPYQPKLCVFFSRLNHPSVVPKVCILWAHLSSIHSD